MECCDANGTVNPGLYGQGNILCYVIIVKGNDTCTRNQQRIEDQQSGRSSFETVAPGLQETNYTSKDEYIARLEAELRNLRGGNAKGSSSRMLQRSDTGI